MIIKNKKYELEISEKIGVYFGSKASGQHFKKWEDFNEEERQQIEMIQNTVENLLKSSEKTFLTDGGRKKRSLEGEKVRSRRSEIRGQGSGVRGEKSKVWFIFGSF